MNLEPRTRLLREYFWFALLLTAILTGSAIQQDGKIAQDSRSKRVLTESGATH